MVIRTLSKYDLRWTLKGGALQPAVPRTRECTENETQSEGEKTMPRGFWLG